MFDTSKPHEIHILSGKEKAVLLRYPTDEELCERTRRLKTIRRTLGGGRTQFEMLNLAEVNAELFEKVRLAQSQNGHEETFDAAEASRCIEKLLFTKVLSIEREGDGFLIEMRVPGPQKGGITVTHALRMPTQKDILDYRRASARSIDGRRHTDIRLSLEPTQQLYDRLVTRTDGYGESHIPIHHKDAVILEIVQQMEADSDDFDPEE